MNRNRDSQTNTQVRKAAAMVGALALCCSNYFRCEYKPAFVVVIVIQFFIVAAIIVLLTSIERTEPQHDNASASRSAYVPAGFLLAAWVVQINRAFWYEWLPMTICLWAATAYLMSIFLSCALPAYPILTFLLKRGRRALILFCSIISFAWSATELAFKLHY